MFGRCRLLTVAATAVALVACGVALAPPASAVTGTTVLEASGDAGDPILGSSQILLVPPGAGFSVDGSTTWIDAKGSAGPYGPVWELWLRAPDGGSLVAGTTYTGAENSYFVTIPHPGMIFQGNGRSCDVLSGSFTILDYSRDPGSGTVERFAATFEQHCDGAVPAARGAFYYHSSLAYALPTTVTLNGQADVAPLAPVALSGSIVDVTGPVAGATVSLSRTDASGLTNLPDATTAADGSYVVSDTLGTSSATYVATFAGDADHRGSTASWVVAAVKYTSTLTVVAPATGQRGSKYVVSGVLTSGGSAVPTALLTVSRKDLAGNRTFTATTNGAGGYSFPDTPAVGGPVTFRVSWAGDVTRAAVSSTRTVSIARVTTALGITASATSYAYGARATVTVHLGTTYNRRYVTVYARPLGTSVTAPGTKVMTARVNSLGNLTVGYTMTRRTTFTAVFTGDYRYAPASRAATPNAVSRVTLTMSGYSGTSGGAYLYRHGTTVYFQSTVLPGRPGGCEAFVAQRYSAGRWVTVTTTSCGRLDGSSTAHMYFVSSAPRGTHYRVRGNVASGTYSLAGTSPWRYFTYT